MTLFAPQSLLLRLVFLAIVLSCFHVTPVFGQDSDEERIRNALRRAHEAIGGANAAPSPQETTPAENASTEPGDTPSDKLPSSEIVEPLSPEFLQWQDDYLRHCTARVLVNGSDERHVAQVLRVLSSLKNKRLFAFRELVVVSPSDKVTASLLPKNRDKEDGSGEPPNELKRLFQSLNLREGSEAGSLALSRLGEFRYSPVWLIDSKAGPVAFEGRNGIGDLLNERGEFIGSLEESGRGYSRMRLDQQAETEIPKSALDAMKYPGATMELIREAYSPRRVLVFQRDSSTERIDLFDNIPACSKNAFRSEFVPGSGEGLDLDLCIFDPDVKSQVALAEGSSAVAAPYIRSALANPHFRGSRPMQELIRAWKLRCLPTRLQAKPSPGRTEIIYREGPNACAASG